MAASAAVDCNALTWRLPWRNTSSDHTRTSCRLSVGTNHCVAASMPLESLPLRSEVLYRHSDTSVRTSSAPGRADRCTSHAAGSSSLPSTDAARR
jgi:hypothetical protein